MDYEKQLLDMLQNQVVGRGVTHPRILEAMQRIPRHLFVPEDQYQDAYDDRPIVLPEDRATISQPYMVAYMTYALNPRSTDKVLEIGTGSGYQSSILSCLAAAVYTVERHQTLSLNAERTCSSLSRSNIHFRTGDGLSGWPEEAPFDRIVVTAAAKKPPKALAGQLKDEGEMLIPLGDSQIQTLTRIIRHGDRYIAKALIPCVFVPLVCNKAGNLTETDAYDAIEVTYR